MTAGVGAEDDDGVAALLDTIARTGRAASDVEVARIRRYVAASGFDPSPTTLAGGRLEGIVWQGRPVHRTDYMPAALVHYLRHVIAHQEWPAGTTLEAYVGSIRSLIRDAASGIMLSRWDRRAWHLLVIGRAAEWRGPDGAEWLMVECNVNTGFWITAFQMTDGPASLSGDRRRTEIRWLRQPA